MYFRLIYLLIIPVVLYFYVKKRNLFKTILLFFILFIFCLIILKEKIELQFEFKKNIPVILMIDGSRSFNKYSEIAVKWKKYFDDYYYFSDTLTKKTNSFKSEFSCIYDNISSLKEKLKNNVKIVVFSDLQDNYSKEKFFDPYNVYFIYKENPPTKNPFIYEIKIDENIFSGESFEVELKVFSLTNIDTVFYLKEKEIIHKEVIKLKKGINIIKKIFNLNFEGFKNLTFGIGQSEIERIINFSKETYQIYLATGYPNEEFSFLRRFLEEYKWLNTETKVLLKPEEKINLRKEYNGHIFINLSFDQFVNLDLKKLTNSIFVFTEFTRNNKLLMFITNNVGTIENLNLEDGKIYILSNNIRIIEGIKSWKIKLKKAILAEPFENFYAKYWFENLKDFLTERKIPLEKYNYILNENAPFDTSKIGIFEQNKIKYKVHYNEKEDFIPISETNNLKIYNLNEIDIEKFVKNLKAESKIIEKSQLKIDFSNNMLVLIMLLVLLLFFWFYNKF